MKRQASRSGHAAAVGRRLEYVVKKTLEQAARYSCHASTGLPATIDTDIAIKPANIPRTGIEYLIANCPACAVRLNNTDDS